MNYLYTLSHYKPTEATIETVAEELNKSFQGTWMIIHKNRETILESIYKFTTSHVYVGKEKLSIPYAEIKNIEIFMPQSGNYQYDCVLIQVFKKITRQYKKSFNPSLYYTNQNENPDVFKLLLKQPTFPYKLDNLDIDSPTVGLSQTLCFCNKENKPHIKYNNLKIADINFKLKSISLLYSTLKQELIDYLNKTGQTKWTITTTE